MRALITATFVIALPVLALAQAPRGPDAVLDALRLEDLLDVMQTESVETGREMGAETLPEEQITDWADRLGRINDPDRLAGIMREDFAEALPEDSVAPILAFLTSSQGERIVGLELSAREALLDPDIEMLSEEMLETRREEGDPRLDLIRRFVEANDLIDVNVLGAMNANAAFLQGLAEGASREVDAGEIAAQVVAQEPQIRADTTDWVYSFLLLAYQPLSDGDLEAYIAFSETEAGQALNAALFTAFDEIFVLTSRETGEALSELLRAQDI